MQLALKIDELGRALLDEVGLGADLPHGLHEAQALEAGAGLQAYARQRRPGIRHAVARRLFGARCGIGDDDVQAMGEATRRPAAADDATADDADGLDRR